MKPPFTLKTAEGKRQTLKMAGKIGHMIIFAISFVSQTSLDHRWRQNVIRNKSRVQYCDTAILQYCDTATLRYCDTTILRYCDTTILRYCDTAILQYCSSSVQYCEDRFHIHFLIRSSNMWLSFIHSRLFTTLRVYLVPTYWPALSRLVSSNGRALHRYRGGHGFKSCTGLNFFQALVSLLLKWCSILRRSLSYSRFYIFTVV